jgi:Zn-dependent alcohol dehydrogenase
MVDGCGGFGFAAVVNALLDAKAARDVGVDIDDADNIDDADVATR